jgi:protein-disulfide isomerase
LSETNKNTVGGTERSWSLLFWLPLIAAALLLLCGCAAQSSQPSGQEPQAGREGQASEQTGKPAGDSREAPQRDAALGHPGLGDADAPVVMVEYADFQ